MKYILGLPYEWQEPKYLSYNLLPPMVHIIRNVELEVEPELEPDTPIQDADVLSSVLTVVSNTCPTLEEAFKHQISNLWNVHNNNTHMRWL